MPFWSTIRTTIKGPNMAKMFNPPHPGALIKDVMTSLNLNVSIAAEQLGISRVQLSRVINARASISTE
ncbi:helix-turn-helix transcriptional regulator, partial [Cupriavidus plantarum]|uniref:helix-turn-helix transcriptional regulator n=1 Tax=Cupriavidus plantarum TaxID=942865 RepID=UPI00339D5CB3